MTATGTIDFDQDHCHGERTRVGTVDVDSGTMAITAGFRGDTKPILDHPIHAFTHGDGYVASTTVYGDGTYEVVTVSSANAVVGVEVLFASATVECAEAERTSHLPPFSRREEYYAVLRSIYDDVWDELLPSLAPERDDLTPHVITALEVDRFVGVGDPCYGSPSLHVNLPSGRYVAVAWLTRAGEVARIALYRH